jgi:hypothetical protein
MGPRRICGPSLNETSLCGAYLHSPANTAQDTKQTRFVLQESCVWEETVLQLFNKTVNYTYIDSSINGER